MTDVSVERPTEETASPSEASGRPARPFSLSLSLSTVEPPLPSLGEPAPSPEGSAPSPEGYTPSPDEPGSLRDEPEPSSDEADLFREQPESLRDEPATFRDTPESFADEPVLTVVEVDPSPAPSPSDGPLPASPAEDAPDRPEPAPRPISVIPPAPPVSSPAAGAVVKGRIKVADEVVEKVAALAALEVAGVAELRDDSSRAAEPSRLRAGSDSGSGSGFGSGSGSGGTRRGPRGVSAHVQDRTAAVDVTIVTEYGHVVMDVANEVKTNVARTISLMLGMRVVEVNVNVDDVRLPGENG
ncbi:Asp23/Gls24 family envelope stress response protein [Streptosporangium sp. DT93]|uniref:Asp23/Gls24 family envelope stress response protein n=1 Tax=Streptosporangium sp. DT93 TaxID=3393428 RepID=UPI003CE98D0D